MSGHHRWEDIRRGQLTQAWTSAEAAKPLGWAIDGIVQAWVYDLYVASPELETWPPRSSDGEWVAMASLQGSTDAEGPVVAIGEGRIPEQALMNLAEALRRQRGDANG